MTNPRTSDLCGGSGVDARPARPDQHKPGTDIGTDIPAQLRRRRVASWRLPPLDDGRRDPLDDCDEPLSDAELDSWRAAWMHLDRLALPAIVPQRVLVASVRRGRDRVVSDWGKWLSADAWHGSPLPHLGRCGETRNAYPWASSGARGSAL
jgi:hypothetical protein